MYIKHLTFQITENKYLSEEYSTKLRYQCVLKEYEEILS